ncbi:signal recognition particle-docking protein FtsY [Aedoeadaptatus pacaensis]|uniref:signal recognition particle-docking protein FtsY n=1 Tax=Aedoeadaptatus pacaensis TaxID=1776390 RepID=UPI000837F8A6|nr:signal recognition particle-docking protein FtsY [Peptoniphilus pacaensis]
MLEWLKRKIGKEDENADTKEEAKVEEYSEERIDEEALEAKPAEEVSEEITVEKAEEKSEADPVRHKAYDFSQSKKDAVEEVKLEEESQEPYEEPAVEEEKAPESQEAFEAPMEEGEEIAEEEEASDSAIEDAEVEAPTTDSLSDDVEAPELNEAFQDDNEETEAEEIEGEEPIEEAPVSEGAEEKVGWFQRLKQGLEKTRDDMNYKINDILGNYVQIDDDMMEDLEDLLISSDMGMETTMLLIDRLKETIREKQIKDPKLVKGLLAEEIRAILEDDPAKNRLNVEPSPAIILIVGVNGVGKTTTIGKLAYRFKTEGKSVLIAAADTFRAAAIEQIETWGERSDTPVISHKEGADPAAVVYDAIQAQKSRNIDVLICDTAGRLHNKKNLMNELEKIHRIIEKEAPEAQKEALLVLDATTGQNAILQAKTFNEVTDLSGLILTKLDGTAKGGVVLPLVQELDIPIKLIGVGEGMTDLQDFSGKDFANALIDAE